MVLSYLADDEAPLRGRFNRRSDLSARGQWVPSQGQAIRLGHRERHNRDTPVQASNRSFQSLEDAYNAGQGALEYWRDKATRAQAKALLAPPARHKDRPKRPIRIQSR